MNPTLIIKEDCKWCGWERTTSVSLIINNDFTIKKILKCSRCDAKTIINPEKLLNLKAIE